MTWEPHGWAAVLVPPSMLIPIAVVHVVLHRLAGGRSLVGSFLVSFGGVLCAFLAARLHALCGAGLTLDGLAGLATDVVIIAGLSYAWCDFLAYGEASVRTRILAEVGLAGDAGLTVANLLRRYNVRVIMDLRFRRLAASGQIRIQGDRVVLGPNRFGQYLLARVYRGMRRVLYGRSGPPTCRPGSPSRAANAQSETQGQGRQ